MRAVATSRKPSWGERFRTSQTILRQSARALRGVPHLWGLPIASALLMVGLMALFVGLGALGTMDGYVEGADSVFAPRMVAVIGALVLLLLPVTFLVSVINAGFVHGIYEHLAGRRITRGQAMAYAWKQGWTLFRFTVLATFVGGFLAIIGQVLGKLRIVPGLGRVFEIVGTFGWAAASFFVIPIIVVERERSATGALKGSVQMARKQFGEMVSGIVTITLALMVPVLAIAFLGILAVFGIVYFARDTMMYDGPGVGGIAVVLVVVMGSIFLMGQLAQAFQLVYQTALYRYARTGHAAAPFTEATLVDAWAGYRKR